MIEMLRWLLALFLLALVCGPGLADDEERAIAVIVHKSNQIDRMDLTELKKVFTLERQRWSHGGKIRTYIQKAESFEQQIMMSKVFHMSETQLDKLWVQILADNASKPPVASSASIKRQVARNTSAIGFIDAALLDGTVKALRINGMPPESPTYPLKE